MYNQYENERRKQGRREDIDEDERFSIEDLPRLKLRRIHTVIRTETSECRLYRDRVLRKFNHSLLDSPV
jgi:hypothetical protein